MEAEFEDCADLGLAELVAFLLALRLYSFDERDVGPDFLARPGAGKELFARFDRSLRTPDQLHDLVEVGDRNHQPQQNMGTLPGFQKLELRTPRDHFLAELDEAFDDVAKR